MTPEFRLMLQVHISLVLNKYSVHGTECHKNEAESQSINTTNVLLATCFGPHLWPSSGYNLVALRVYTICLTLRSLTLYIYGAPILDVSRSHTTTQHSR